MVLCKINKNMDNKIKLIILFIIIFQFSCTKNNTIIPDNLNQENINDLNKVINNFIENKDSILFPKIMYVVSKDGLRERSEASINSNIIKVIPYGEVITVYAKTDYTENIDEIIDYWYSTNSENDSWVFGGYISKNLPPDVNILLGLWENINNERNIFEFKSDQIFKNTLKYSSIGLWGTWVLNGENIIVNITQGGDDTDFAVFNEIIEINLIIIDSDNINLIYPDNEIIKLKRIYEIYDLY